MSGGIDAGYGYSQDVVSGKETRCPLCGLVLRWTGENRPRCECRCGFIGIAPRKRGEAAQRRWLGRFLRLADCLVLREKQGLTFKMVGVGLGCQDGSPLSATRAQQIYGQACRIREQCRASDPKSADELYFIEACKSRGVYDER